MTLPIYCADDWLMIRSLGRDQVAGMAQAAQDQGWEDVVPGLDSLSLSWNPAERTLETARAAAETLLSQSLEVAPEAAPPPVTLHICYDSVWAHDADIVAELLGITTAALPQWHAAQTWCVAMLGFQPGFGYLTCDAAIPEIPRLSDPRSQVAAGSVGLLGHICGLYPHAGPGGWPIIGRIAETLFDPHAGSPALLTPGQKVVFEQVDHATLTRLAGESA